MYAWTCPVQALLLEAKGVAIHFEEGGDDASFLDSKYCFSSAVTFVVRAAAPSAVRWFAESKNCVAGFGDSPLNRAGLKVLYSAKPWRDTLPS